MENTNDNENIIEEPKNENAEEQKNDTPEEIKNTEEPENKEPQKAEELQTNENPGEKEQEALEPEEPIEEKKDDATAATEKRWYVIQTLTGQEDKVKKNIENTVEKMHLKERICQVLVPEEETVEIKGGKRMVRVRKMFPGYVFVEMYLDDETWYAIRQAPGVARFIGSKTRPTPASDREMQRVLKQLGVKAEKLEVNFDIGETVRVISGPFRGYTGTIKEISPAKGKLKVLISIFGRDTPVEVNFEHAEKFVS